jgi:hypothetical protein
MAGEDDFHLVLFDRGEDPKQLDIGTAGHRTTIWSQIFRASLLVVAAAVIAFALVVEDPRALLADATAFVGSLSAPQDGGRQEASIVRAEAQVLPPTASVAPTNNDIAAPSQNADQHQTDIAQAPAAQMPAQALLGQFQAWAAGQTAQADVPPVQPVQEAKADPIARDPGQTDPVPPSPVQEAQNDLVKNDPVKTDPIKTDAAKADPVDEALAEVRPAQHHRLTHRAKTARAEIRAKPSRRAKLQREQDARAQVQRPQDPRAQVQGQQQGQQDSRAYYRPAQAREPEPPAQNARPPSFLESIGLGPREQ